MESVARPASTGEERYVWFLARICVGLLALTGFVSLMAIGGALVIHLDPLAILTGIFVAFLGGGIFVYHAAIKALDEGVQGQVFTPIPSMEFRLTLAVLVTALVVRWVASWFSITGI